MKEKKYLILGLSMVLLTIIGVTFAYFSTNIIGDRKNITVGMSELKIIFNNGDDIVAENFYAEDNIDIVKTFSVENKTRNEYKYDIVIEDLVNTFVTTGFLVYKITSDDGGYNMKDFADVPKSNTETNVDLVYNISIPAKGVHNYTIEVKYINSQTIDQNVDQEKTLSGKIFIQKGTVLSLNDAILRDNTTISERTDFSVTNTANTTGTLYKTNKTEDGSDVYYYSGNTINNWVKFGKETRTSCTYNGVEAIFVNNTTKVFKDTGELTEDECISTNICSVIGDDTIYAVGLTEEECGQESGTWTTDMATYNGIIEEDIYWRIVRTNEDNSIRLLYSGLNPATTKGYIGTSQFNSTDDNPMYAGYMYGTSGSLENNRTNTNDSIIKTYIDNWYEDILLNNYNKYISKTAIYCNDRSVQNNNYSTTTNFDYGSYSRLNSLVPSYKCGANTSDGLFESTQAITDKFSASTTGGGNGQLKYPIALMTADEVSFAGGVYGTKLSSPYAWYYTNSQERLIVDSMFWWSMSPNNWDGSYAQMLNIECSSKNGRIGNASVVIQNGGVRPVVSLDSCVNIKSGDGTPTNPYVIDYDNSCIGEV